MIPAFSLSYIATIDDVSVALPSTGTSRCRVTAWVPWTTIAGLNVPAFFNAEPIAAPADHDGERRQHPLLDAVGVLGGEGELVGAGADPDGVQQGVLAVPADVDGFALGTDCFWIERHRRRLRTARVCHPTGA